MNGFIRLRNVQALGKNARVSGVARYFQRGFPQRRFQDIGKGAWGGEPPGVGKTRACEAHTCMLGGGMLPLLLWGF